MTEPRNRHEDEHPADEEAVNEVGVDTEADLDPDEALQLDADPDHEPQGGEADPDVTPIVNPDDPSFVAPGVETPIEPTP